MSIKIPAKVGPGNTLTTPVMWVAYSRSRFCHKERSSLVFSIALNSVPSFLYDRPAHCISPSNELQKKMAPSVNVQQNMLEKSFSFFLFLKKN